MLVTRVEADAAEAISEELSGGDYDPAGRLLWFGPSDPAITGKGLITIISAGTADLPVAVEAAGVARRFGNKTEILQDVGVAGSSSTTGFFGSRTRRPSPHRSRRDGGGAAFGGRRGSSISQ